MHRVDTEGHDDGLFQDGTPQVGQQGTMLAEDWFNDLQENICGVIEDGAGEALVKGDYTQLRLAIASMIAGSVVDWTAAIAAAQAAAVAAARVPVGTRVSLDGGAVPAGWLAADGAQYLRADYPDLVDFYDDQGRLIAGDTGAQFRMPDYRGRFDRAWSADDTVDPDGPRAAGSLQADDNKSHNHAVTPPAATDDTAAGLTTTGSGGAEAITPYNTASSGGDESRPKNVASIWIIKT